MHIEEITTNKLSDAPDRELYSLRLRFIQLWNRNFAERDKDTDITVGKLTRSQFLSKYRLLVSEMRSHRLKFNASGIDHALFGKRMSVHKLGFDTGALEETTLIPEFVSLVGSYVVDPEEAEDVDVLVRKSTRDESVEMKVSRILAQQIEKNYHYIYAPTGPHGSYVPLFDLVLKPRSEISKVIVKSDTNKIQSYYEGLDEWSEEFIVEFVTLLKYMDEPGKIIDLGCGSGRVLRMLKRLGFENLVGVDINEHALELCEKAGLEVKRADLSRDKLPYDDQSFDVAICTHVLEHVEDETHLLNEAQRVAKLALFVVPLGKRECRGHKHEYEDIATIEEELGLDQSVVSIEGTNSALITLPVERITRGGEGSGFFGHAGRPGEVGGSTPGGLSASASGEEWTPGDTLNLQRYSYGQGRDLTRVQRGLKTQGGLSQSEAQQRIKATENTLSKLPSVEATSYRGVAFKLKSTRDAFLDKVEVGGEFVAESFMSTTRKEALAGNFATEDKFGVVFKIEGLTGRDIAKYSTHPREEEILFVKGSRFEVTEKTEKSFTLRELAA